MPVVRSLPKDSVLDREHDCVHLIIEGRVKVFRLGPTGTENIIANLKEGDFFGGEGCPFASASIVTLVPSRFLIMAGDGAKKENSSDYFSSGRVIEELLGELQRRERELFEVEQQKNAISEILRSIAKSPTDVQSLLKSVVENAGKLCDTADTGILQVVGHELQFMAKVGPTPIWALGTRIPISRGLVTGRSVIDRAPVHVHDLQSAEAEFPDGAALAKQHDFHTTFATPLMRGDKAIGSIFVRRCEVRPFTDKQIKLLVAFADQAAIVIENMRLFNEIQEKSRQLNEQAKELAGWNVALETRVAAQVSQIERLSKLEHELALAAEIQISMLPRFIPELEGYQFGAKMIPAKVVGGDFFDFIPMGNESIAIAIGDVSDKGIPAALFMAMVRSLLRAEAHPSHSPKEVLRRVNRHLIGMNDKDMFVTMILGTLNRQTREFLYARAGHEAPIYWDGRSEINRLPKCNGQALGVFDEISLEEQTLALSKDSVMLLYSDGITEAPNSQNERFGSDRIKKVLYKARYSTAEAVCNALLYAVREHQGDSPQDDDMTAVVVQAV